MRNFEAVIFDMDGLMFDTERIGNKAWKKATQEFGINAKEEKFYNIIGLKKEDGKRALLKEFGEEFNYEAISKKKHEYYTEYLNQNGTPIKKGLLEIIEFLEKNNIPKAIGSSSKRETVELVLRNANLLEHFPNIIAGDDIINGKPNPEIFLKVSEKLNMKPNKCLVLEDSNAGIKAAHKASMKVIMIPDLLKATEESEKIIFKKCNSLLEVIDILKQDIEES